MDVAIRSFAGRAIERLHSRNDVRGVNPAHVARLRDILSARWTARSRWAT